MIYDDMAVYYALAGGLGLAVGMGIIMSLACLLAVTNGRLRKRYLVPGVALILIAASVAVWGLTARSSRIAATDTEATSHFARYGLHLTGEEAAEIRTHYATYTTDHTMYLDAGGITTEILFRKIDGVVEPFATSGDGTWFPMEPAA